MKTLTLARTDSEAGLFASPLNPSPTSPAELVRVPRAAAPRGNDPHRLGIPGVHNTSIHRGGKASCIYNGRGARVFITAAARAYTMNARPPAWGPGHRRELPFVPGDQPEARGPIARGNIRERPVYTYLTLLPCTLAPSTDFERSNSSPFVPGAHRQLASSRLQAQPPPQVHAVCRRPKRVPHRRLLGGGAGGGRLGVHRRDGVAPALHAAVDPDVRLPAGA